MSLNSSKYAKQVAMTTLAAYWAIIAWGTHIPGSSLEKLPKVNDGILHFVAYTGLAFLLCWSLMRRHPSRVKLVAIIVIALTYGAVDELTQQLVPNRSAEWKDWIADSCGAAVGIAAYFLTWRMVGVPRARPASRWGGHSLPVKDAA